MVLLRGFLPKDVPSLQKIVSESLNEYYDQDTYFNLHGLWPDGLILAEENGRVIGFLLAVVSGPQEARILVLAIEPEFRGKGIGTILLRDFISKCVNLGFKWIKLEVRVSNKIAIKFYNRFGFTISSIIPHYYSNGEDGYVMWRGL